MSGTIQKRSRKSKLVPRSFKDSEDSDILQDEPKKKQKLSNASSNMDFIQDQPSTSAYQPLQFDIKVEVEECDEFEMANIKSEIINENDLLEVEEQDINMLLAQAMSTKQGPLLDFSDNESEDNNTNNFTVELDHDYGPKDQENTQCITLQNNNLKKTSKKLQKPTSHYQIELGEEDILNALDELSKQTKLTLADNILGVEARNLLGCCRMTVHKPTMVENQVQIVLNSLKISSKDGEVPLMYKCYICEKAWWHLGPFQDHLSTHDDELRVEAESHMQSIHYNIVAYSSKSYHVYNDFRIDSNCWRCGYKYEHHVNYDKLYQCEHCSENFQTCTKHRAHEAECVRKLKSLVKSGPIVVFTCHFCKLKLLHRELLEQHYMEYHDVRSDLPIFVNIRCCALCSQKYASIFFHYCTEKNHKFTCHYCANKFPSKLALDIHLNQKSNFPCAVCCQPLPKKCMLADHMLKHTTKFVVLYKMRNDKIWFLNEPCLKDHIVRHKKKVELRGKHFKLVLVPSRLIDAQSGAPSPINENTEIDVENINPEDQAQRELDMAVQMIGGISSALDSPVPPQERVETDSKAEDDDLENDIPATTILIKQEQEEFDEMFDKEKIIERMKNNNFSEDDEGYENILSSVFNASTGMLLENQIAEETGDFDELIKTELKNIKSEPSKKSKSNEMTVIFDNSEIGGDINLEVVSSIEKPKTLRCYYKKCKYKTLDKTDLKLHRLNHNGVITCSKCDEPFISLRKYLSHLPDHGFVKNSCPECLKTYTSFAGLNAHIRIVVDRQFSKTQFIDKEFGKIVVRYQCKRCKELVPGGSLTNHWEKHLSTVDMIAVKVEITLGEGEVDVDGIQYNESDDSPENLSPEVIAQIIASLVVKNKYKITQDKGCIVCGRKFRRHNDSKRHHIEHLLTNAYSTKVIHRGLRCQICGMTFDLASIYKHHMRGHSHLREYKCSLCFKTFSDASNYVKHKKIHSSTYICDLCNRKFEKKNSIIKHMETHTAVDPMPCQFCPKKLYSETELAQHVRKAHNQNFFKCLICKKKFKSLKDKWDHMWLQHKERQIKADCPVCNAEFRKVSDMKSHLKDEHQQCITVINSKMFKQLQDKVQAKIKIGADPSLYIKRELSPFVVMRSDYRKDYEIYSKDDFYGALRNGIE